MRLHVIADAAIRCQRKDRELCQVERIGEALGVGCGPDA